MAHRGGKLDRTIDMLAYSRDDAEFRKNATAWGATIVAEYPKRFTNERDGLSYVVTFEDEDGRERRFLFGDGGSGLIEQHPSYARYMPLDETPKEIK